MVPKFGSYIRLGDYRLSTVHILLTPNLFRSSFMPNISVLTLFVFVLVLALFAAAHSDSQDIVTVPLTKRNNFTLPDGTFDFQAARRSILTTRSMYQHNVNEFLAKNIPQSLRKIEFIERLLPLKGSQPLNFDPQVLYTGKITIGNPTQEFTVGFATASGNTWIGTANCKDKNTGPRKRYISCKSHDFKETVTRHHRMKWAKKVYSDGYGYRDTMTIANIVVKGQYFIGVYSPPERYVGQVDGMVGLAFDGLSPRTPYPFMDSALKQEQIKLPIFGVSFAPANSEFHFGGTNPKLYWSPLEDHKVIHFKDGDTEPSYWLLGNAQLQANGKPISNNMQTIISTGFEFTFGPKAEVKKIYASIHGYRRLKIGAYVFPCGSAPKVTLSWDDKEKWEFLGFEIPLGVDTSNDCFGSILEHTSSMVGDRWMIGTSFLKNVYTAFNVGAQTVSFGKLKEAR